MTIGFNVYPLNRRVSQEVIENYRNIPTSHISDNMNRIHGTSANIIPYHRGGKLLGSALTVRTRPGDNLMIHKAINMAEPGDVLIVDGDGDMSRALFGEIMLRTCQTRGIAGLVVDGCIRDVTAFREDNFPVYARGVTHKGPYKTGPGEINTTVSIGGLIVNPGDLIIGDEDGVVSVPIDQTNTILQEALKKIETEEKKLQLISDGEVTESFVSDELLIKMGCKIH
ncbi:RraA family protein [Oceanobacillus jeddahense]|uniref:RraA family protein n=1 Tax=Oceanobacillus jeddahense TaxID=1462527 RepID=UPI000595D369|nr:RraA family protein [Oceanobacillus jeddahense]